MKTEIILENKSVKQLTKRRRWCFSKFGFICPDPVLSIYLAQTLNPTWDLRPCAGNDEEVKRERVSDWLTDWELQRREREREGIFCEINRRSASLSTAHSFATRSKYEQRSSVCIRYLVKSQFCCTVWSILVWKGFLFIKGFRLIDNHLYGPFWQGTNCGLCIR